MKKQFEPVRVLGRKEFVERCVELLKDVKNSPEFLSDLDERYEKAFGHQRNGNKGGFE